MGACHLSFTACGTERFEPLVYPVITGVAFLSYACLRATEDSLIRTGLHTQNMRSILQLFNIKVLVFPERVEIKGAIPTQILDKSMEDEPEAALIISSPPPSKGRGIGPIYAF